MTHTHTRTEVGICQALRSKALHQNTYDRIRTWIPTSRDNAYLASLLAVFHLLGTVVEDAGVDIEAVYGVDTEGNDLLCILRARAGRGCEDSNIYILQLGDVIYYFIVCQLSWFVLGTLTTYNTCNLKVRSCFECLNSKLTDVAVSYYGCSKFLHCLISFILLF